MALQKQTISLQEQNTNLQTQNAKLQVENSTLNSQSTSLMNQNSQLLLQQSSLESENESLVKEREELKSMYDLLVKDHEKLAQVHERQAAEYESLISKHGTLKSAHKNLEVEHKDLEDRYNQLLKQKVHLEDLEKALKEEQAKMLQENKEREMLSSDYQRLTEEHQRLNHTYRQLLRENESLQSDHKNQKTMLNSGKLEQTRLEAEFSKLKEKYQKSDITVTNLTNQCELLRQVKGNLEEENRHLMGQNQILALQNKTLLDQNMESKDFYQGEQRQYMDKINELRRQKEKLEEKIMDQYKFYEPSPPRRRGNWITLKMRKLIKSKKDVNRDHLRSLTLPNSRSESGEGFLQLPPQDSQDSSSIGSNSLEDGHPLGAKKSSTLKRLPFMRNRPKDKDKMKALYRRSVSMNDLVQSMVLAGGQWTGSAENLEGPDEIPTGKRRQDLGTMAFSTTAINFSAANQSTGFRTKQILISKDGASYEDVSGQGVSDDSYTTTSALAPRPASLDSGRTSYSNSNNNASLHEGTGPVTSQNRSQSHSSGDFYQQHDNEVWSNNSSPVQYYGNRLKKSAASSPMLRLKSCDGMESLAQSKKRLGSPGSEMVSLKQFLEESNKLSVSQIRSGSQEDLLDEVIKSLSSSAELLQSPSRLSPALSLGDRKTAKPEHVVRSSSHKAGEHTRFPFPTVINASSDGDSAVGQGTVSQQQQTNDSKQYATLPRASSVISTAEGTNRRTSIHDFLSKDSRSPVSVDPSPTSEEAPSLLNVEAAPEIRLSKSRSREQQIP